MLVTFTTNYMRLVSPVL